MSDRFTEKVVWITGASSGIGRALALEFAREGAIVAVSARRRERLDELVGEIEADGGKALAVPCDVTCDEEVAATVQTVVSALGKLDVAVANAGFGLAGSMASLEIDDWRRQFDTNVFGLLATVKQALPHLEATSGRLALVGSVAAWVPFARAGPYSASKAAVRAIGETLSIELEGSPVSCTTVHPGFVSSEIAQIDRQGQRHPERKDRRPAGLLWSAGDAARVILRAVHRRKREFIFTGHGRAAVWAARHFPGMTHMAIARSGKSSPKG